MRITSKQLALACGARHTAALTVSEPLTHTMCSFLPTGNPADGSAIDLDHEAATFRPYWPVKSPAFPSAERALQIAPLEGFYGEKPSVVKEPYFKATSV